MGFDDVNEYNGNGKDAFEELDEFLEGGGGPKAISWKDAKVGRMIEGVVYDVQLRDKLNEKTKAVELNQYGQPKKVMILWILTNLRDQEIEGDTGVRRAFLQGNAIFEARKFLKDNNIKLRFGCRFRQTLTGTKPTEHFNDQNLFQILFSEPTAETVAMVEHLRKTPKAATVQADPWASTPASNDPWSGQTSTLESMRQGGQAGKSSGPTPF